MLSVRGGRQLRGIPLNLETLQARIGGQRNLSFEPVKIFFAYRLELRPAFSILLHRAANG